MLLWLGVQSEACVRDLMAFMPPLQIPVCRSSSSSSSRKRTTILTPNSVVVAAYGHPNNNTSRQALPIRHTVETIRSSLF